MYGAFAALIVLFLAADFLLLRAQGSHKVPLREAAAWSVVWFLVAMAFAAWLWWHVRGVHGAAANAKALEYVTGYLVAKALAMENVFVWVTIFTFFATPPELQKRVLLYGVGAILMRAVLIYLGVVLIQKLDWIFYVLGAFLLFTGVKMLFFVSQEADLAGNPLIRWMPRRMRIIDGYDGEKFVVGRHGLRYATPILLVLVLVEVSGLIFAVDSIPAIFAVTSDPFIVFTSNIFAILGLRAMYLLLADMAGRLHLLSYGLAFIVMFVGVKMLIMDWYTIPIPAMLGVVFATLALSIGASLARPHRGELAARLGEVSPGLREADPPPDLLGQRMTDRLGKALDLERHRRLREMQRLGGARHALPARHRLEDLELAQGHMSGAAPVNIYRCLCFGREKQILLMNAAGRDCRLTKLERESTR